MHDADVALRNVTYRLFVELGRAPAADEVAAAVGVSPSDVHAGWRRLSDDHALVLQERRTELLMANPFSAVPTPYRVSAAGRWWYANCAWDAFGVCAALATDGRVVTTCRDCGDAIAVEVRDRRPGDGDSGLLFHCLVPAGRWWDDIIFT